MRSNYAGMKISGLEITRNKTTCRQVTTSMQLQNRSFQSFIGKELPRNVLNWKNARATRAKLLVVIVKYANLWWRSRVSGRLGYLSHFHMGNHWDLKVPSTNCKASRTTVKIPRDFETKGKLCRRQPKLRALSCFQLVTSFSPFSFPNALSPFLSSFSFILK